MSPSPLAQLLMQITAIVVASRMAGLVFRRLGQPQVVAEIAAGLALGPSLLGWAAPGLSAALFPADSLPSLHAVANLGLVLFLFVVGLEFDPALVRGRGRLALVVGVGGVVAPFAVGAALAVLRHGQIAPPGIEVVPFAAFLGVALAVTAFPVLARILLEEGLAATRLGALALSSAAVADVLAWCLLAVVVSAVRAGDALAGLASTGSAVLLGAAIWWGVRPALAALARRLGDERMLAPPGMAVALIVLTIASLIAEGIGIHALIGAFLAGLAMPRRKTLQIGLARKIEDLVVVLLLPVFFAATGLRLDLRDVFVHGMAEVTATVLLLAVTAKLLGTSVPARLLGMDWREALALGALLNTRGLMELVVLSIGRDLSVLTPELHAACVLMALLTTAATRPMLHLVHPRTLADAGPLTEDSLQALADVAGDARGPTRSDKADG